MNTKKGLMSISSAFGPHLDVHSLSVLDDSTIFSFFVANLQSSASDAFSCCLSSGSKYFIMGLLRLFYLKNEEEEDEEEPAESFTFYTVKIAIYKVDLHTIAFQRRKLHY